MSISTPGVTARRTAGDSQRWPQRSATRRYAEYYRPEMSGDETKIAGESRLGLPRYFVYLATPPCLSPYGRAEGTTPVMGG